MVTKTITITEAAYKALKAKKKGSESFSEVILRMGGGKADLLRFCGSISKESAERLERAVIEAKLERTEADIRRRGELRKRLGG